MVNSERYSYFCATNNYAYDLSPVYVYIWRSIYDFNFLTWGKRRARFDSQLLVLFVLPVLDLPFTHCHKSWLVLDLVYHRNPTGLDLHRGSYFICLHLASTLWPYSSVWHLVGLARSRQYPPQGACVRQKGSSPFIVIPCKANQVFGPLCNYLQNKPGTCALTWKKGFLTWLVLV